VLLTSSLPTGPGRDGRGHDYLEGVELTIQPDPRRTDVDDMPTPAPRRLPLTPAPHGRRAVALGILLVILIAGADAVVGGRAIPLTAVLLGPLLASAVASLRGVALVAAVAFGSAVFLTLYEQLPGAEAWTRVGLVLVAGLASCLVAHLRTGNELALAQADRVAGLSHALQRGLVPALRDTHAVEVRAVYRPTQHGLVVGGDFLDVVPAPYAGVGAVAFCVGDVTGHDAPAASLGASLRAGWRALALTGGDPAGWLAGLDELVLSQESTEEEDRLATVCVGVLEPGSGRLTLASAGHPRPVLLSGSAAAVELEAGPPLGIPCGLGGGWQNALVDLPSEFSLVVYTDGLVEGRRAPGSTARYGEESLAAWLDAQCVESRVDDDRLDLLLAEVEAANGGPLRDDVALVVLSDRRPPADDPAPITGRPIRTSRSG
jgi:serine phosphatase RsbU (regulator of sigma subunit)